MKGRASYVVLLAALLSLFAPTLAAAESCDIRKELLALIVAVSRYDSLGTEVILKRLPLADGIRAKADYDSQLMRLTYLCKPEIRNEQSQERAVMILAIKQASGVTLLLTGASVDDPLVTAGHEARMKMVDVAGRYFDTPPRR
jgi:hypothetical protein